MLVETPGRNVHAHGALAPNPALTPAHLAGLADHGAFAGTGGAWRHRDELPEHAAGRPANLATSAAGAAGDRLGALLGAASIAGGAALETLDLDRPFDTQGDFGERQPDRDPDVLAPPLVRPGPPAPPKSDSKPPAEVAHEDVERFAEIDVVEPEAAGAGAHAGLAVAIVGRALLRVAQHLVRLGDLLEPGLRLGRRVAVRVVFHGQLPVGLLDLGLGSVPGNTQQHVEIAHSSNPSTRRLVCSTSPMILS